MPIADRLKYLLLEAMGIPEGVCRSGIDPEVDQ